MDSSYKLIKCQEKKSFIIVPTKDYRFQPTFYLADSPLLISDGDADGLAELVVAPGNGEGRGGAECEDDVKHGGGGVVEAPAEPVVVLSLAGLQVQQVSDTRPRCLSRKMLSCVQYGLVIKGIVCDLAF